MNIIFLDYDLQKRKQTIKEALESLKDTKFIPIQESVSIPENISVRGIVLTQLNSGFLAYHLELIDRHPEIQHWIVCVAAQTGEAVQQTLRKHFAADMASRNTYCEIFFDDTPDLKQLKAALEIPAKSAKKCVIVSQDAKLAESVGAVLREYLPKWEVIDGTAPDYRYCDAVIAVGNRLEELCVPCPQGETIKKYFWLQTRSPKNAAWRREQSDKLKEMMNEHGWNLSDYRSRTGFSNLLHEHSLLQIQHGEMHPMALLSETQFVMWDDYGLPIPQSAWNDTQILDFLEGNTVFPFIAKQLQTQKR